MLLLLTMNIADANSVLLQQLSAKDGSSSCLQLAQENDNIQAELQQIVIADIRPSYVPMRAAKCLLRLYPEDVNTYREWMINPEQKGLAYLVVNQMSSLPIDVSLALASQGLNGPLEEELRIRLHQVSIPEIQQLLHDVE